MKSVYAAILSLILFATSSQSSLIWLDYQCNRDFYEQHCINKDKPEMQCHGKCQMKKETEKTSDAFQLLKYCFEYNYIPQNTPTEIVKLKIFIEKNKISAEKQFNLSEGFLGVPNPPPVS